MLGVPGAGKSTWVRSCRAEGALVIEGDVLRRAEAVELPVHAVRRAWFGSARDGLRGGRDVVVDTPTLDPGQRRAWLRLARAVGVRARLVVVDPGSFEVVVRRQSERVARGEVGVPVAAMRRYWRAWVVARRVDFVREGWSEVVLVRSGGAG